MVLIACDDSKKLDFESVSMHEKSCVTCPEISIEIPKALGDIKIAESINTALKEEIIYNLSFEESGTAENLDQAVKQFTGSFKKLQEEFKNATPWEAEFKGEVIFENEHLLTIKLNSYTFTGGAHGFGSVIYLNFDKDQGTELDNWQLFKDYQEVQKLAENKFREQEKIPQDVEINATGFMFNGNQFHLAENIGFTPNGLELIYNQYEVASYADGPITLALSYDEIKRFLKYNIDS